MRQSLVALCLLALCASASLGSARASQLELQHQSDAESRADSAGDLELEAGLDASTEQDIPPLPNEVMGEKNPFERFLSDAEANKIQLAATMTALHQRVKQLGSMMPPPAPAPRPPPRRGVPALSMHLLPFDPEAPRSFAGAALLEQQQEAEEGAEEEAAEAEEADEMDAEEEGEVEEEEA